MASSVSSNGGSNNVMIRSKSDSIGVAGGHTATAMDERNTQGIGGGGVGGGNTTTTTLIGGLATGPERRTATTADDSAISFSEEEEEEDEDEMDGEGDDDEEEDDHRPESSEANAAAAAAAAAFNAAAAAAFQRQLLANFPLFHHASDGSSKLDNDPSNASAAMEAMSSTNNSPNPFESYIAAAAAAAAAANAEALFRQHQQQLAMSGSGSHAARLSEKRTAHDSGTDDNDLSLGGGKGTDGSGSGKSPAGIHQQPPSNKRRKQSKPVRISSDQEPGANDENATSAVTAFLAAQTAAAAAALFHQNNPNASSEEEEEGVLLPPNSSGAKLLNGQHQQQMLEWVRANNHMMTGGGSHESEQEEGQIIRSSSANSSGGGHMFDHQLASRLMMAGNSSSAAARSFADFLASTAAGGGNGKGFPLFPSPAYGGSWNQQQQQMMMNIMSMNRSGGMIFDDGEVSRSSSHCSGSPTGGLGGGSHHHHHLTDAKKNHPNDESGERSSSDSPFAFRNMLKYGGSASGGFYPSGGPSVSSPFLFPFLQSSSAGNSPLANHSMGRGASGGLLGSPSALGGSIRIFNHEAYCELCNKEFCNKYFLKTHKANKHGIYVDNIPPTPPTTTTNGGGGVVVTGCSTTSATPDGRISGPASISTPSSSSNGTGIGSSNGVQSLPFSVSSSFGPPSLSLTVGAMTYPMHPPSTELAPIDPAPPVTYSPIMTTSPSKSIYQTGGLLASASMTTTLSTSATTTIPSLSAITTPTSGMSAPPGGLMDFFPMWPSQTSTPPVMTSNNTLAVPSSLNPISTSAVSMKHNLQHLPGGIVNPEAYCELCQKEFCNKYFLKRHKAKMHGIIPPEGSAPTTPSSAGTSLPSSSGGGGGGGGSSSHKRSKSHSSKQTAPLAIAAAAATTTAIDLIKIPITLPSTAVTSPARNLPASGSEAIAEQPAAVADPVQESNGTTSTAFNLLMQGGLGSLGIKNETGGCGSGGVLPSSGSKLDLSNSSGGGRQDNNSLSLLKIPTPSLSAMFSTPSPMMESHPARIHHSKTPSSSSSSGGGGGGGGANGSSGGGGMVPQQLFSPERLRQMGVINTEAFCEICCKEFCNKYFLRTHKFKKHGIGSMPEQQQQQQSSAQQSDSSSSTGMIRQHHYNNNNNNNKRGGPSPTAKQLAIANSEFSPEQKAPLNLVTTPSGTLTTATTTTTTMGQQQQPPQQQQASQLDGGMPLSCDLCQRPFQSTYLLHMHRTYFHNQPPPADESMNENDMNDTSAMDEDNQSDNGQEDDETGTFTNTNSPQPPSIAVKSEPEARNADAAGEDQRPVSTDANNSSSGGITISADLQKLQSMIMELNGSSSAAAAAAAAASMAGEDRRRCWMDGPVKSAGNNINQLSVGHNESGNHYISASGGGIVKIVNPATSDPSDPGNLAAASSSSSSVCHLCSNKDFVSPSFLQIHMQNFHGIGVGGSGDPSAAAMEAAVAAAASQLGFDRLLDFGPPPAPSSTSGHHHMKRSSGGGGGGGGGGRSSSSASPAATRSYCQICNKELCNKYFMKTHMLKMHGIHLEASGGGSQIGGVQCDICHKELCSKYFLKVHKQNTHGIVFPDHEMLLPNGVGGPAGNMLKEQQHQGVMDLSFHQHHHHHQQQQQQQQQMQQQMMEGSNSPVKSTSVTESCPLCPKRFKSSKALKAHLSHEHSGSSGSSTAACCYICSQQFGDVVALQVHLIKSHASHLMDHHQTPPPPVSVSTSVAAATPTAGGSEQQQANQGCPMSSPSPKTSPSSFQRSSYCDYSTGYLFANERGGQMGESCPPPPPMPGLVPASANASPRPSSAVGTRSPPAAVNQQKIQCPLCGHQLPLEQFQTHLMAHQFPINFLHTLMPPSSSSAGTATAPESHAHEEQEHDELGAINQQQQQQQQQRNTTTTPTTGRRKRRYRCSVCSRKFATRQLCLTHILQRHPPSMRSSHNGGGGSMTNAKSGSGFGLSSPTSPVSTCHMIQSQQRPLTCPRCGYATRQPQLLRLHLRTQQCIPVVARNPDLQQLPPYLAVPTSTASMGGPHAGSPSRLSAIINNKQGLGLQSVQGQHAHRQDFVLQAFLLTQPDAETNKSSSSSNPNAKNRRGGDPGANQENGHHNNHDDQVMDPSTVAIKRENQQNGNRLSGQDSEERKRTTTDQQKDRPADAATKEPRDGNGDDEDEEEEGQNQSCNFIPSLILLPVNRRIANPLSLTFSLTPA